MTNIINGFDFDTLPIKVSFVGKVEDKEWPHYLWNVTITNKEGFWTIPYKTGLGLVIKAKHQYAQDKPKVPTNADIMYCLLLDKAAADQSFDEWCTDHGCHDDSLKALYTYQTCCEYAVHMKKTFTKDQLDAMQKALEDY